MSDTANLTLPYLSPGQAQKHVTVNESLRRLDAIVQLSATSATLASQPASPADGAVYILPAGKTGTAWGAMADGALAYWRDGSWEAISPREGWLAYVRDTDTLQVFNGTVWTPFSVAASVSTPNRLLGRVSAGAGPAEEILCTAAGRALIDDADAAAQRTTLGLGSAATMNTGASGAVIPLLNGANTWATQQVFTANPRASATGDMMGYEGFAGSTHIFSLTRRVNHARLAAFDAIEFWTGSTTLAGGNWAGAILSNGIWVANTIEPAADNARNLGSGGTRWGAIFAATGTINTSDAREKTDLRGISAAERRAVRTILSDVGVFQWRESVERKGPDGARLHVGVTAQAVAKAFEAEGLDPGRYALFCEDALLEEVEEEQRIEIDGRIEIHRLRRQRPRIDPATGRQATRLGVRYDQLLMLALSGRDPA